MRGVCPPGKNKNNFSDLIYELFPHYPIYLSYILRRVWAHPTISGWYILFHAEKQIYFIFKNE